MRVKCLDPGTSALTMRPAHLPRLFISSFIFVHVAETLSELRENLKEVIEVLTRTEGSVTSISSGCELFLRFITLASLDNPVCLICFS